jgi:hypothetical protein
MRLYFAVYVYCTFTLGEDDFLDFQFLTTEIGVAKEFYDDEAVFFIFKSSYAEMSF